YFKVPFISLDIAVYQEKYHLIEFQFTSFGTYTVGKSPHHWIRNNNVWEKITGKVIVEELMADSIIDFIKTSGGDR
ncbi:MAG: hypothetical protein L6Q47_16955, partial [Ignavibacteriaceae bacterium]|nr:hypothetical protein [Ignavibacteriaceae bacterium]